MEKITDVVAALIWKGDRFLICRRPANKKRALLWEFVGGKVEQGESGEEALIRECREELGIEIGVGGLFCSVVHEYPDITVRLSLYFAEIRSGEPKLLEHSEMAWIRADEAENYDFCPADYPILRQIREAVGQTKTVSVGKLTAAALLPGEPSDTAVYIHGDFETAFRLTTLLPEPKPVLVAIDGADWDDDLSPWEAEGVFRGSRFGGHADEYLKTLTNKLIPAVEREIGTPLKRRILAGYSLAGLFALWAAYRTDLFDAVASVSGSLWYEGFLDFIRGKTPAASAVYLSLGDREEFSKNPRLRTVAAATDEAAAILISAGIDVVNERNPGGHFNEPDKRLAKGIAWLLKGEEA